MPDRHPTQSNPSRVLIVEDDAITAVDLKGIVQDLGYSALRIASSASEALQLAESEGADIALVDIRLKGKADGVEVAGQLVARYKMAVVFVTAHTDDTTLDRALATNPFGYVAKPFTAAAIKTALAVAFDRHREKLDVESRYERCYQALDKGKEAIIICDEQNRILFINEAAEELTGSARLAALGQRMGEVVKVRTASSSAPPLLTDERPELVAGTIARSDRDEATVLMTTAEFDKAATPAHHMVILHDVSDLKAKIAYSLRGANALLTRKSGDLAYLSKTLVRNIEGPIRTAGMYSDLLAMMESSSIDDGQKAYLRGISETCRPDGDADWRITRGR